jgi:hypothetical protein
MAVTAVSTPSVAKAMNNGDPAALAQAAEQAKLGKMLTPLKRTFTGLTSLAAQDLTAIDGVGETVGPANENRKALLVGATLRVTAGAAAAGARILTDVGGTPSATVATISDDGKTVTFEAAVTAFIIEYMPRAAKDMTSAFATT